MKIPEELTVLTKTDEAEVVKSVPKHGDMLPQDEGIPNVIGVAAGVKWTNGIPTGDPALLVLVTHKVDKSLLTARETIPEQYNGMQTDVLAVGNVMAGITPMINVAALTRRMRPARGGMSVGHYLITAGSIATVVYDILPGGIGIPSRYYILSNNHVLANSNNARIGDPILQPGPYDGGTGNDQIGTLARYMPLSFYPSIPLEYHQNVIDGAIAEVQFADVERGVYATGPVKGWARRFEVFVGQTVRKVGRTTNLTIGRVTATNAVIDVGYGNGQIARFRDQFVTTNMCQGGDSGSLVTDLNNRALGLLFAGSSVAMIANQIEWVRAQLGVEVADSSAA